MNERKYVLSVPQLHARILQLHKLVRCRHAARHLASGVREDIYHRHGEVANSSPFGEHVAVVPHEHHAFFEVNRAPVECGDTVHVHVKRGAALRIVNVDLRWVVAGVERLVKNICMNDSTHAKSK